MGRYKTDSDEAVLLLVRGLEDEDEDVRGEAACALIELGASARPAIPALVEALGDQDVWVRRYAAQSFRNFPGDVPTFLNALIEALRDSDSYVREEVADSLGRLGASARPALQALKSALREADPTGRMQKDVLNRTRLVSMVSGAIGSIEKAGEQLEASETTPTE